MFCRDCSSSVGSEDQEVGNELCVDPVCLGAGSQAAREGLDLGRWHLAGPDARAGQAGPEPPFLPASRLEAYNGSAFSGEIGHGNMTVVIIGYPMALTVREAMIIEPVAAHVYPDDPTVCYLLHALLLLIRGPERAAGDCSRQ